MDGIEVRVGALEREVKEIKGTCKDISDRLIRMEETLKNSKDTTVDFKTYNQAIMEMSGSVRLLTEKVSEVLSKLDKQDERICKQDAKIEYIEKAPGKAAMGGWKWIATSIGGLLLTAVGAAIGLYLKGGR